MTEWLIFPHKPSVETQLWLLWLWKGGLWQNSWHFLAHTRLTAFAGGQVSHQYAPICYSTGDCSWKLVLTDFCLHFTSRGCSEGPRYCHNSRVSLHLPFPWHVMHTSTVQYRLSSLWHPCLNPPTRLLFSFFSFVCPPPIPFSPPESPRWTLTHELEWEATLH